MKKAFGKIDFNHLSKENATDFLSNPTQHFTAKLVRQLKRLRHTPAEIAGALKRRDPEERLARRLQRKNVFQLARIARRYPIRAKTLRTRALKLTSPAFVLAAFQVATELDKITAAAAVEHLTRCSARKQTT